jgi:probable phosphoglycerate mutase
VARIEPELHELDYGDYEGRTTADIRSQHPGWSMFKDGSPHGESVEKFSERADRVLASLRAMDGTIALFSRGQFPCNPDEDLTGVFAIAGLVGSGLGARGCILIIGFCSVGAAVGAGPRRSVCASRPKSRHATQTAGRIFEV